MRNRQDSTIGSGFRLRAWRVVMAAGLALALAACSRPVHWHGADLEGAGYGQAWELTDSDGKPSHLQDYHGQVVLIYFGYTRCPDMCPMTLGHLRDTLAKLDPAEARQVRVLFVTVDPEHDTPAVMREYVANFGPRFTGLTGSQAAVDGAAKAFKVFAEKKGDAQGAPFEHAGFVFALDRTGQTRVLYGPDTPAADMATDIKLLLSS